MEILNESCLLLVVLVLASLQLWDLLREHSSLVGWACVSLVLFSISVNFISVCPRETRLTIKAWRRVCCKSQSKAMKIHIGRVPSKLSSRREHFRERDSTSELKLQIKEPVVSTRLKLFKSNLGVIRESGEVFSERNELE